ncbi:Lrp/AsnC family transcriptional regulator [Candidatus Bathyarchaeota archaeon]|nr:Lrp/AsnC family transcriptional regulator [Candidatus Bathyarchaeota archaeon]
MKIVLDELDKKIVTHLCSGAYSYKELAKLCHVGRSTIYRRIDRLEKASIISRRIMAIPNFTNLNLTAVGITMDIDQSDVDQVIEFLKGLPKVKFLWRSYGCYNVVLVSVCDKGSEGECISKIRKTVEEMGVKTNKFEASVSFIWEKVDLNPF